MRGVSTSALAAEMRFYYLVSSLAAERHLKSRRRHRSVTGQPPIARLHCV